ncbi:hypothetical protein J1N35_027833 [Gossypium stocksii]|uniref:tRNA (adenine(58)-N(1))-methyltransferase catalytic subunit TRM61 C-terminal domain-containing protein n=1 Tax=Gossypium stocksii TaxID=47602 RepID=A0A9D3VBH6_9ROSI|nr:hypothetical protein J1N35_027833 [Gossypium stocksii]
MELCSFSPCIEQVQRSCETLRSDFTDIWTFEILLRNYEIREWKMDHSKVNDGNSTACPPRTRRPPVKQVWGTMQLLCNHVPKKHTCYSRILKSHPSSACNFRMKIEVEGCMHGDLDKVYDTIKYIENARNIKIVLLLCCGDFQAVRNEKDMDSLNVPPKYREMKYYGGWAAPNIYFLGFAGVEKFGNIRIGGLSGIYNARNYCLAHHEKPLYNDNTIRSVYHVREYDVHKLMPLEEPIDVLLSIDWPLGITNYGNWQQLVRYKKHFKDEIQQGTLGSKPAAQLLEKLKPSYWFSAHLHCKFTALVEHEEGGRVTKFLALYKCLPGRKFLQLSILSFDHFI